MAGPGPGRMGPTRFLTEEEKQNMPKVTKELLARIISYLKPEDETDWSELGSPVMEIWPSEPLEDKPDTGTRDYSPERLEKNERMGYEETKELLDLYVEAAVFN